MLKVKEDVERMNEDISNKFRRQDGESVLDYIERVLPMKEQYLLTWQQMADIINEECGVQYSESFYRKGGYVGRFSSYDKVENQCTDEKCDETSEEKRIRVLLNELKREKVKLSDERTQNNAYVRRISREETLKEIAKEVAHTIGERKMLTPSLISGDDFGEKEAILELSDWHYGIICDSYWNKYNPDIAKERLSKLLSRTVELCKLSGVRTIHVVNLSDLVCGRIHLSLRLESRYDVVTQTEHVAEMMAEFLSSLSDEGFNVEYYDCSDNHSRVEPNRGDSLDLESFYRFIPWYLKVRLNGYNRISINENEYDADIVSFTSLGHRILGVHGDKDKPNLVVDSLSMMTKERPDLILTAHMHHFSADEKNEVLVVSNGSMMGTDTYAKNLRLTSKPSQNLIIVSDDCVMETLYRIVLD